MLISNALELLGVASVYPILMLLINPKELREKWYIRQLIEFEPGISDSTIFIILCVGVATVFLVKNLFSLVCVYVQYRYAAVIQCELSKTVLSSYLLRDYEFFVSTNSSLIIQGILSDTSSVYSAIISLFEVCSSIVTVVIIGAYLIKQDIVLTISSMLVSAVSLVVITFACKKRVKSAGIVFRETSVQRNKAVYESIFGIKEIKTLGREKFFLSRYNEKAKDVASAMLASNVISAVPKRAIEATCICGFMLFICFEVVRGVDMTAFMPVMGTFAMGVLRITPSVATISSQLSTIVFCIPGIKTCCENMEFYNRNKNAGFLENTGMSDEVGVNVFNNGLHIRDIVWRYSNSENPILQGLSIDIAKGEAVGFVGRSGGGKTTLADVILGLYRPQSGSITINDCIDISTIPELWKKTIGYVPQAVYLTDDTIRANVAFGLAEADVSDEDIWKALERAQLKDFVESLPDKLETFVGESGVRLSGGQRQRIALARALYDDPDILVLDEATSALDTETESAVMETIESLQGEKTLIVIAHRLSTIKNCDHIYEIKDGIAFERAYEELVKVKDEIEEN